jgi:uncharacterized Zn finger protein
MWRDWSPYVSVADRRARAARAMKKRARRGLAVEPVIIEGRNLAHSFWGQAWCRHLEAMGDLANRLPRGRSYVRNGSVCHLGVEPGRVHAFVMGNELYEVELTVAPLPAAKWRAIKARCAGAVGSVLELLEGRLSAQVMRAVTHAEAGLFPERRQIGMSCSCPDWASVCKHVAAVFYGVGARLDQRPELLFELRGVDHRDLIGEGARALSQVTARGRGRRLASDDLAAVFGIELAPEAAVPVPDQPAAPRTLRKSRRAPAAGNAAATPRRVVASLRAMRERGETAMPASRALRRKEAPARQAAPSRSMDVGEGLTAATVRALRLALRLDAQDFARLLGVSPVTVARWECADGTLKPQARPRDALQRAAGMTAEQARRALSRR